MKRERIRSGSRALWLRVGKSHLRAALACGALLLAAAGGCGAGPNAAAARNEAAAQTADEVLAQLAAHYRQAKSYADQGVLRLKFTQGGTVTDDPLPYAVQFVRPNRVRIAAYGAVVACDGQHLRAALDDPGTNNFDGQFVERAAPPQLTLADLASDPELYRAGLARNATARHPFTLSLLLESEPLAEFFAPGVSRSLLAPAAWEGRMCHRVRVEGPAGAFVFWVDRESKLLLRLEFPADEILADLRQAGEVGDLSLAAEFRGAACEVTPAENTFALVPTGEAKRVRYFVLPPEPPASNLLGQKVENFSFPGPAGEISSATLAEKIAVLVWFGPDASHRLGVQEIARAAGKFANEPRVALAAVCTAGSAVSPEQLTALTGEWNLSLPLARDMNEHGRTQFGIQKAPCVVVRDGAGVIHLFELVENSNVGNLVVAVVERLLRGDNVAADVLRAQAEARERYTRLLSVAQVASDSALIALAHAEIAPRSEPQHVKLHLRWTCGELTSPGNLLVVPGAENSSRIFAFDGFRTVVELNAEGNVVARHKLPLPERVAVSALRSATGANGRRYFAVCGILGSQAFVFDEDWKLAFAYPAADERHDGIRDIQIADLAGDGEPELLVGFWNLLGVHAVNLEGRRLWSNRTAASAQSLAVSPANEAGFRKLLVVDERGMLVKINHAGLADKPHEVAGRFLRQIAAAHAPPHAATPWLTLAAQVNGTSVPVALNDQLREAWKLPLDFLPPDNELETLTVGPLFAAGTGHWVVAGAEGTLTLVSDDGHFVDRFAMGKKLSGAALAQIGGQHSLLLASGATLEAWTIELPAAPK